jgi:hypothetical protein
VTAVDYGHTSWAQEQRTQKAVRLEAYLRSHGYTVLLTESLAPSQRRQVERAAGVRTSSDETWQLVLRLMRSSERPA